MKNKKLILISVFMLVLCACLAVGCANDEKPSTNDDTTQKVIVNIVQSEVNLEISEEITLIAEVENTTDSVLWKSEDKSIAIIDENGKVTALKKGSTNIIAIIGDVQDVCTINVTIPPVNIHFYEENINLKVGDMYTLEVSCINGENLGVDFDISDEIVEIVSKDDKVIDNKCNLCLKAMRVGSAVISITINNAVARLPVNVFDRYDFSISGIKEHDNRLFKNNSYIVDFVYTKNGEQGDDNDIVWTISDPSLAEFTGGQIKTKDKSGTFSLTGKVGDIVQTQQFSIFIPISNKEEFLNIANDLNANYMLTNSLDFGGAWVKSIAAYDQTGASKENKYFPQTNEFEGIFDGNGYAIMNYSPRNNNTTNGLFGAVGEKGIIRNVSIINVNMYLGGAALVFWNEGKIENVYAEITVTGPTTAVSKNNPLATIVSKVQLKGSIKNCVAHMNFINDKVYDNKNGIMNVKYGCIAGYLGNNTTMENCYAFNAWGVNLVPNYVNNNSIKSSRVFSDGSIYDADFTAFDEKYWNIAKGKIPVLKNTILQPQISGLDEKQIAPGSTLTLKDIEFNNKNNYIVDIKQKTDGINILENYKIQVEADVELNTEFVVVIKSFYNCDIAKEIKFIVK